MTIEHQQATAATAQLDTEEGDEEEHPIIQSADLALESNANSSIAASASASTSVSVSVSNSTHSSICSTAHQPQPELPTEPLQVPEEKKNHKPNTSTSTSTSYIGALTKPELDWSFLRQGRLYGRDKEIEQLRQAFYRRVSPSTGTANEGSTTPELVLVSGQSGTGKTALVKKALQELLAEEQEDEGYFLLGKFDQLQIAAPVEPYGPFVAALAQWMLVLEQRYPYFKDEMRQKLRSNILEQVGKDACLALCALVPSLDRVLLGFQTNNDDDDIKSASESDSESVQDASGSGLMIHAQHHEQDLLKQAFKKLFPVICATTKEPLVLVLDDLQWADAASLHLLELLVSDDTDDDVHDTATYSTNNRLLMVVGICRSNEVPLHHNFAGLLRRLEDEGRACICHVMVNPLPIEATTDLMCDMLQQPPAVCHALSEKIHAKTNGNVFFMLQYIKTLYEEGVLFADRVQSTHNNSRASPYQYQYQWLWKEDQWDAKFQNLDVVELVSYQIQHLPLPCQRLMKTAACMGAEFYVSLLRLLLDNDKNSRDVEEILRTLSTSHMDQMIVPQVHRPGLYAFAHDRIQQAAYSLIPKEDRPLSHLSLGRCLFQGLNKAELQDHLFLVANQLVSGISLLTTERDKVAVAELCLQAGKKASKVSDFNTALAYFRTGTELVSQNKQRHWRDQYHLSLELFNAKAEAECSCGDYEHMEETLKIVLANCRTPIDKIRSHRTMFHSLGARSRFREGLDVGMEALASLGEKKIPSKPRLVYLIPELIMTKRRLRRKSDSDILSLPSLDVHDKNTMEAVQFLYLMVPYSFWGNQNLFPFLILRLINLSLQKGINEFSCTAFALYAMVLGRTGQLDAAYRYAMLSLQLLNDRTRSKQLQLPRLYFVVYGCIAPFRMNVRDTLEYLQTGSSIAAEISDVECAVYTAYTFLLHKYIAGDNLTQIDEQVMRYMVMIKHFKQGPWLALTLLFQRFLHSLMGKSAEDSDDNKGRGHADPIALDLESIERDIRDFLDPSKSKTANLMLQESPLITNRLATYRLILGYHFGDLDLATTNAKAVRAAERINKGVILVISQYFYGAMAELEAAFHTTGGARPRRRIRKAILNAHDAIKKLENLATHCPNNVLHKAYLLRGEVESLNGNLVEAIDWYQKAMEEAVSEGVGRLHALANERAAIAYQRLGDSHGGSSDSSKSDELMSRAIELYDDWGGKAIAAHLRNAHKPA